MIKKIKKFLIIIPALGGIIFLVNNMLPVRAAALDFDVQQKHVFLTDSGILFEVFSGAATVQDFLDEQKILVSPDDVVFPEKDAKIYAGTHVLIWRAKKITIKEGGDTKQVYALGNTVEQAIWENKNIKLADDDITSPARQILLQDGMTITVTHIIIKEETQQESINYKIVSNEDDSLGWRVKKVTQKGEKGTKEVKYKVVYHNGKEISRKVLESDVIKDPIAEIITQGTSVKLSKTINTGFGTWYAQPKYLELKYPSASGYWAANPWLPMGSYAKVTNKANGKSVIVRINDRGPFGENRIIDLGKPAFAAIASLGAGVIDVKMEAVMN